MTRHRRDRAAVRECLLDKLNIKFLAPYTVYGAHPYAPHRSHSRIVRNDEVWRRTVGVLIASRLPDLFLFLQFSSLFAPSSLYRQLEPDCLTNS